MAHVALLKKVLLRVLATTGHSLGGKVGADDAGGPFATRHKQLVQTELQRAVRRLG
jgi:hypothetical protein